MHTSYGLRGTIRHPSLGSWVLKLGGRLHPELPGFVAVNSSPELVDGGFLGATYAAAPIGNPEEGLKNSHRRKSVSVEDFDRRLAMADKLNRKFHGRHPNRDVKADEELYREAVALMNSKDLKAFVHPAGIRSHPQALRLRAFCPRLSSGTASGGARRWLRGGAAWRLGHGL